MISLITLAYNHCRYTEMLFTSLADARCLDEDFELIFINNGSTDETEALVLNFPLRRNPRFKRLKYLTLPENQGVAAAINQGVRLSSSPTILQADNDVVFGPHSLSRLLAWNRQHPRALISPNWPWIQKQLGTQYFKTSGEVNDEKLERLERVGLKAPLEIYRAAGSCWLCSRELFEQVGGWDEGYLNICASDDFIWKIGVAGALRMLVPGPVYHTGEITRKNLPINLDQERKDSLRFRARWGAAPEEISQLRYWQRQTGTRPDPVILIKGLSRLLLRRRLRNCGRASARNNASVIRN